MSALRKCLQCDEDYYAVKAQKLPCEIWGGYEYVELEYGWPAHRWRDWKDHELAPLGIKPEAYDKYRRTPILHLEWLGCDDTVRGHQFATSYADQEWSGARIGQCTQCGHTPETETR